MATFDDLTAFKQYLTASCVLADHTKDKGYIMYMPLAKEYRSNQLVPHPVEPKIWEKLAGFGFVG